MDVGRHRGVQAAMKSGGSRGFPKLELQAAVSCVTVRTKPIFSSRAVFALNH